MAPPLPPKNPSLHAYHLSFLLLVSTATLSAALSSSSYSSACPSLKPASDRHTEPDDVLSLTRSFQTSNGYISGGADSLFSRDDDLYGVYRSFSLFPHGASRTSDQALVHLTATLTLTGPRTYRDDAFPHNYTVTRTISFVLDGYYSSASFQLCMVGAGTEQAADGSLKHYPHVALSLRIPSPPKLTDPFVTGTLEGSDDLSTIHLLGYAEGDDYSYGSERVACDTPTQQARGSLQALGGVSSAWCAHLKSQLVTSYRLQEHGVPYRLRMDVNQMQCAADASVRAYVVFSNDTRPKRRRYSYPRGRFQVDEEAVVAEGQWDQLRGVLCLRACRVVRERSALAVREHECGIRMRFWFPAVWTIWDRSLVAGMLWNLTQEKTSDAAALITASSIDGTDPHHRSSNLSDVTYSYNDTMLGEARKHYNLMKFNKEKIKGSFPGNNTYRDMELDFYGDSIVAGGGSPVTLGSVMVYGDRLAADHSFSQHAVVDNPEHGLLSVSYDIHYSELHRTANGSYIYSFSSADPQQQISAEGVYDPQRGILCMVGCREHNGSTDCQILVTVKFSSLEARRQGHGRGVISSLRDKTTDSLFFEKMDITLYRMFSNQASEAISRMDMESIMLVASTTLSCVFTILQILHIKKNPEAARATSITMLAILTLGCAFFTWRGPDARHHPSPCRRGLCCRYACHCTCLEESWPRSSTLFVPLASTN
ncbi:unnamed protein product [Alopecurus aequalis]